MSLLIQTKMNFRVMKQISNSDLFFWWLFNIIRVDGVRSSRQDPPKMHAPVGGAVEYWGPLSGLQGRWGGLTAMPATGGLEEMLTKEE